jgi:hypothetical protein
MRAGRDIPGTRLENVTLQNPIEDPREGGVLE